MHYDALICHDWASESKTFTLLSICSSRRVSSGYLQSLVSSIVNAHTVRLLMTPSTLDLHRMRGCTMHMTREEWKRINECVREYIDLYYVAIKCKAVPIEKVFSLYGYQ